MKFSRKKSSQSHHITPFILQQIWNQRLNSETHPLIINKQWIPRTVSLDLNSHNAALLSPQFSVGGITSLKKSPWTPNYQKGWSSERVPLPINVRQRYLCNGKALPSKWEDAERWIGSPISVDGTGRYMPASYYRRPKSKSGPLGSHSPLVPCFDSGRVVNVAANSPFLAGVLVTDRQCYGRARGEAGGCRGGIFISDNVESYIVQQSAAVHAWSDLSSQGTARDEKFDSKGSSIVVSPKVLLKDMATEMSPSGSSHSSPGESSPSLVPPSADPIVELEAHFAKMEVRDVQVDGLVTVSRHPKNHVSSERCLRNIIDWKNKSEEDNASTLESADPSKFLSEYNREEAKIRAWRNLQEAKAETAIRKLEMELEKQRSSSMDKILNKLRSAQRKAEDMRNAVRDGHAHRTRRKHRKAPCLLRSGHMSFLGSCFTCKAS
ncbi:uncharacterized protein LOC109849979 isoform X2 [Asparagus officinalis]|uniref:uncharacterized protein LOC109849979 isoform X2 n=1 Tax=Asparagus officinalis TaxID=4686 RepID=UPI00098E16B8|nr:uncharacterized protein LOC109849979 isoform X2 [Asparagus officinalis]